MDEEQRRRSDRDPKRRGRALNSQRRNGDGDRRAAQIKESCLGGVLGRDLSRPLGDGRAGRVVGNGVWAAVFSPAGGYSPAATDCPARRGAISRLRTGSTARMVRARARPAAADTDAGGQEHQESESGS